MDGARLRISERWFARQLRRDRKLEQRAKRRQAMLRRAPEEHPASYPLTAISRLLLKPIGWSLSKLRRAGYELLRWLLLRMHRQFLLFDYSHRALELIGADLAAAAERGEHGQIVIHAHDLNTLYPGTRAKRRFGAKLIYDSHELQLGTTMMTQRSRVHRWLYQVYEGVLAGRADAVITVCGSIAEILKGRYRLDTVEVIRNCPVLIPPLAPHDLLRRELNIPADTRIALYHGNLAPRRGLETLVHSAQHLEGVAVVLLGSGPLSDELSDLARALHVDSRVFVHPAVPQSVLPRYVASADIAVVPIQSFVPNYHYSLPNKLFEAMMAGLPVAASNLPEIQRIVESERVGAIFDPDDPVDTARAIQGVLGSPDYEAMKARAVVAARERHNWGLEVERLVALYGEVLGESTDHDAVDDRVLRAA
jgi:glycosyltransferase involved in cell wall biosynthesis